MRTRPIQYAPAVTILALALGCAPAEETTSAMNETAAVVPDYTPPAVEPASRDLVQADIERLMDELSNWGRWGDDDQLGAANLITPAKRLEAVSLVTEGITVSLEHHLLTEEADDVPLPFERRMLGVPDPDTEPDFLAV